MAKFSAIGSFYFHLTLITFGLILFTILKNFDLVNYEDSPALTTTQVNFIWLFLIIGALGVLAYYGYQNLGGKTEDVQVGELYNDITTDTKTNNGEKDLQTQAKEEVAKVVSNATNAWGTFWKGEYNDMNGAEDDASAADVKETPIVEKEE